MFIANMYVDVYRSTGTVDEYDIEAPLSERLVYTEMPLHATAFRPRYQDSEVQQRRGQQTSLIADARQGYDLLLGDRLQDRRSGRQYKVLSIDETPGAFMNNSVLYELVEWDAAL